MTFCGLAETGVEGWESGICDGLLDISAACITGSLFDSGVFGRVVGSMMLPLN